MPRLSKIGAAALAAFGWTSGSAVSASYLVVAGGGGGGFAGGGGAGGLLTGTLALNPTLSYTVTVGSGGTSFTYPSTSPTNGNNSVFSTITATGGGKGGHASTAAGSGGSGGGAAGSSYGGGTRGTGTSGQGSDGGTAGTTGGGGGGGSSAVGSNGSSGTGGAGGAGTASSISGSSVNYAGGGGGGGDTAGTASFGGGAGASGNNNATAGTANTGGGGGGVRVLSGGAVVSGSGGSGIVIISYAGAQQFGGGVITTDGTNTIHTFTTSGTLSPITPLSASYLVVAGGGGGSGGNGGSPAAGAGGGGAGGYRTATATIDTNSIYVVTVGAGGAGGADDGLGVNGSNSVFLSTTSTGGGRGGSTGGVNGATGGSGGGGQGKNSGAGGAGNTPSTSPSQGSNGGAGGTSVGGGGGGGGGASTTGTTATSASGGAGGAGTASSLSGASVTYAGGGGGGNQSSGSGGSGGTGGGGAGGTNAAGTAATANTGGGGGGGGVTASNQGFAGGAGGSGIVIISYPGSTQQMAGGTVTITGGNVIHTFTSSGYLTPIKLVGNSLRFRSSASAYLNRTPASASNQTTWTLSMWVKRGSLSGVLGLFNAGATATTAGFVEIDFQSDSTLIFYSQLVGTNVFVTTQVFRDPAAWYHLVFAVDTTQATASNRVKLYVNGVQVTSFSSTSYPAQNSSTAVNSTGRHVIGSSNTSGGGLTSYFDGYMTEINFIDGQALTPNSFGTFNSYGVWQPITYGGSYGTNGFYLPFTNKTSTTTLGYDFSPNGNNWTPSAGISLTAGATYDSMTDVPTLTSATAANFATLNPIRPSSSGGFSNGNLTGTAETSTQRGLTSTIALPWNGKWYAEVTFASSIYNWCGVTAVDFLAADINTAGQMSVLYYASNGNKYVNGTASAYGASYTTETIGIAFDGPAGTITFYKANTSQGAITLPSSTVNYVFCQANAAGSAIAANWNFGQQPWTYTPPTGFVALNTYNL